MDISSRFKEPLLTALLSKVADVANELGIPFFVVGATARDLILLHGFGVQTGRATKDIDLGFSVASWSQYTTLKDALVATGDFKPVGTKQRMHFQESLQVDVLPFGEIVGSDGKIRWQPHEDTELNLLGFDEAYRNAIPVKVSANPNVEVRIASPTGLVLLKIFAWDDRRPVSKDAIDLGILIRSYMRIGNESRLWDEHNDLLQEDDFDYEVAWARILGRDLAAICENRTRERVLEILNRELEGELPLVVLSAENGREIDRTFEFWDAIRKGLAEAGPSELRS